LESLFRILQSSKEMGFDKISHFQLLIHDILSVGSQNLSNSEVLLSWIEVRLEYLLLLFGSMFPFLFLL
jgi:hypothetical protein